MRDIQSLSHVNHVVWVPKYRCKTLYGKTRRRCGELLQEHCRQKGVDLIEGHAQADHIHMCLGIPPKYSIAYVVGFLKGKSAIRLSREFPRTRRGKHFWVRGYSVSTVGLDEKRVLEYIRHQNK